MDTEKGSSPFRSIIILIQEISEYLNNLTWQSTKKAWGGSYSPITQEGLILLWMVLLDFQEIYLLWPSGKSEIIGSS